MLTNILLIVSVLIALFAIAPIFMPARFSMTRSISVKAPPQKIFQSLIDLNEFAKWGFPEGDPSHRTQISGSGIDSVLTWRGERTGEGKMTITQIEDDVSVTMRMEVVKPLKSRSSLQLLINPLSDSKSELVWNADQDLPYFQRYFGLFLDSLMGKQVEECLTKFKSILETKP